MDDSDRLCLDFASRHPDSFAKIVGRGGFEECDDIIQSLPADRKATIVARLPAAHVAHLLDSGRHRPADWLVDAPLDEAVTLLSRIPREMRLSLVNNLDDHARQRQLLRSQQYPAHSVGALVSDIPMRFGVDSSAAEVLAELRKLDDDAQAPVVIVAADGRYLGMLDRWRLLLRSPTSGSIKDYLLEIKAVRPEMPVTAVAMNAEWHTRSWLPVIDYKDRVLGVVSREKVMHTAGVHSGSLHQGGDILLDLLSDLVGLCEVVLLRTLSRKDPT